MVSDTERDAAERRMASRLRKSAKAVAATYRQADGKIVVSLDTGVELLVPASLIQGLAGSSHTDLQEIELTPTGLGLHWPRLDADLYVPGLLEGRLGSRSWMASSGAGKPPRAAARKKPASSRPRRAAGA